MKTIFENMISMILMLLIVFIFTSFLSLQFQMIKAMNINTSAIEAIQNSYFSINSDYLNSKIDDGYFEIINDNNYKEVIYHYDISLPFLSYKKECNVKGIAR